MIVLGLALALAAAAGAETTPIATRNAVLDQALACRGLADTAARAACYDAAIDALAQAQARGEVVVVDAARVEATHREAFGLTRPPAPPLAVKLAPIEDVSLTVARAWRAADGDWMLAMSDGQVWRQIDGRFARAPQPGFVAEIKRAALGSYLMQVDGQTAVRARREK
ncbi:hypothetical protein [Caulobacter sp. 17J80-11]|uniref:hypothetical protein n=1 Tax=Caulobacter sp. 17J80-11 TaxID=2763502 RepID=UPI0016536D48|nr:hypothetical protein [Caulobacter sp. 17J80-11]MBC6981187.1 hypothetical protein [Caulobacter sp. 17J80-11]